MNRTVKEELFDIGFKGALLHRLLEVIDDNEMLNAFYSFIIQTEGAKMTKVLLVHKFIEHVQNQRSYADVDDFVAAYESAETAEEKEKIVGKLIVDSSEPLMLKKVVAVFEANSEKISRLYSLIVKWRKMYKPHEIVTLLESMPI